jgi:hypothetical protein
VKLAELRQEYHREVCARILTTAPAGVPNLADTSSATSIEITRGLIEQLGYPLAATRLAGQRAGKLFEELTCEFLMQAFALLRHLRPGEWEFFVHRGIAAFEQYEHLAQLQRALEENPALAAALGADYLVTPDIVVGRYPVSDAEINRFEHVVDEKGHLCRLTPLREGNRPERRPLLHASISCKWTIRSDRAQNIRTEALNLIRNRKGHTPHVVVVTAEPMPTRLASLALGTGDLDCVYHFALPELREAVLAAGNVDQLEMLDAMVEGRRLRDISDLPFDLAA